MNDLLRSTNIHDWKDAIGDNHRVLDIIHNKRKKTTKTSIKDLDYWYRNELGPLVLSRTEPHITKHELLKIVERKLMIGTFRPGFLNRILRNSDDDVIKCSKEAFRIVDDNIEGIKLAIKELTAIYGVGVVTATAILSLKSDVPYFGDGIASLAFKRPTKYDLKDYEAVYKYCLEKQKNLSGLSLSEIQDAISVIYALEKDRHRLQAQQEANLKRKDYPRA